MRAYFIWCISILWLVSTAPVTSNDAVCWVDQYRYSSSNLERFNQLHKRSIFQIRAGSQGDNPELGTGFLVSENMALTAAHVVMRKDDNDILVPHDSLELFFPELIGNQFGSAEVIAFSYPEPDIALLRVELATPTFMHGLPVRIDRNPPIRSGDVLAFGFALKQFGTEPASPLPGAINANPNSKAVNYQSESGDSGGPVIVKSTGHVVGMHLGSFKLYNANKLVWSKEIAEFLLSKFPTDETHNYFNSLRNDQPETLTFDFNPHECNQNRCWENVEIARVALLLREDENALAALDRDKLRCPFRSAAQAREMFYIWRIVDELVADRLADGKPTQSGIDEARNEITEIWSLNLSSIESDAESAEYAARLERAELLLVDAGIATLSANWANTAGRFCASKSAKSALTTFSQITLMTGAQHRIEQLPQLDQPEPEVNCDKTAPDELASALFFDAATAANLRAQLLGSKSASSAPVYYAATTMLTENTTRAHEAYRGITATTLDQSPVLAARSALSAYLLQRNPEADARDYSLAISQIRSTGQSSDELRLPPPADLARENKYAAGSALTDNSAITDVLLAISPVSDGI